jgi:hypothetical protein
MSYFALARERIPDWNGRASHKLYREWKGGKEEIYKQYCTNLVRVSCVCANLFRKMHQNCVGTWSIPSYIHIGENYARFVGDATTVFFLIRFGASAYCTQL